MIDGMPAAYVLGQPDFTSSSTAATQAGKSNGEGDATYDEVHQRLFVVDTNNSRVLVYDLSGGVSNGMNAAYVLGQPDFTSRTGATTRSRMRSPYGAFYDATSQRLFVADSKNNRVLVYDLSGGVSNGMNAAYVLGQTGFTSLAKLTNQSGMWDPYGVTYDAAGQHLFVMDTSNSRVLIFDARPAGSPAAASCGTTTTGIKNGMNASCVLGQAKFYLRTQTASQSGMYFPFSAVYDAMNQRLFVDNSASNRVLVYDLANGVSNGMNAAKVLGQRNFSSRTYAATESGMWNPNGLAYDATNHILFVVNNGANRVLAYDLSGGVSNGMSAANVLGQPDFTSSAPATTQAGMKSPDGIAFDATNHRLFVTDTGNSRVLVYDFAAGGQPIVPPGELSISELTVSPPSVMGGETANGTVTFNNPAPAEGLVVTLSASPANSLTLPSSVTINPGETSVDFDVATKAVTAPVSVTITATLGNSQKTVQLTINPPPVATLTVSALSLSPTRVYGGASSVATVTLSGPAPDGGQVVPLSVDSLFGPSIAFPASVTVKAGEKTATFNVKANPRMWANPTITATLNGSSAAATLTLTPQPTVVTLVLSPASVTSSGSLIGKVTLSYTVYDDQVVTLSAVPASAVTLPASVTFKAGENSNTFDISTKAVTSLTNVAITAALLDSQQTAQLKINPPPQLAVAALALSPAVVINGDTTVATVTLSGPAPAGGKVVALSSEASSNSVTYPASVTVKAGETSATFNIRTHAVTRTSAWTTKFGAFLPGSSKTVLLTINPIPVLSALSVSPASVVSGATVIGKVTLNAAPSADQAVSLSENSGGYLHLPAKVTVKAGETSSAFSITAPSVYSTLNATIKATYNSLQKSATLTVNPLAVSALTLSPATVDSGESSIGKVTINSPAPAAGLKVWLSVVSRTSLSLPASVTVNAGETSATFEIKTLAGITLGSANITATFQSSQKTVVLVINPKKINLSGLIISPVSVYGGDLAVGTVTLDSSAPAGGQVVQLSVSPGTPVNPLSNVTVKAGKTSANFNIAVGINTTYSSYTATITAKLGDSRKTATLAVNTTPPTCVYSCKIGGCGSNEVAVSIQSNYLYKCNAVQQGYTCGNWPSYRTCYNTIVPTCCKPK